MPVRRLSRTRPRLARGIDCKLSYYCEIVNQITWEVGGITDHDFENLAPGDLMIARTRRAYCAPPAPSPGQAPFRPASTIRAICTAVRSGDFLADAKIAWRAAYEMQMRAAVRPLQPAADWGRAPGPT
jgi:hypothetical protein